jgi:hypothetical protein
MSSASSNGLGDEVGRAELQAAHFDVDVGRRRQHEHALLRALAHDLAQDHDAVDVAHAQVEHDQLVPAVERRVEPALAAERDVDGEALRAQRAPDKARDVGLGGDHEHAPGGGATVAETSAVP